MASDKVPAPDFRIASEQELKQYLQDCWIWGDEESIRAAFPKLERRGLHDIVERYKKELNQL